MTPTSIAPAEKKLLVWSLIGYLSVPVIASVVYIIVLLNSNEPTTLKGVSGFLFVFALMTVFTLRTTIRLSRDIFSNVILEGQSKFVLAPKAWYSKDTRSYIRLDDFKEKRILVMPRATLPKEGTRIKYRVSPKAKYLLSFEYLPQ